MATVLERAATKEAIALLCFTGAMARPPDGAFRPVLASILGLLERQSKLLAVYT
jgi:hypothetical protein